MFSNAIELRNRNIEKDFKNSRSDPELYLSSFCSKLANSSDEDDYIDLDSSSNSDKSVNLKKKICLLLIFRLC